MIITSSVFVVVGQTSVYSVYLKLLRLPIGAPSTAIKLMRGFVLDIACGVGIEKLGRSLRRA